MYTYRRRKYIVDRKYQFRFALVGVVYIATVTVCLALPFMPLMGTLDTLLIDAPGDIVDVVVTQKMYVKLTFLLCAIWMAAAWVVFAFLRSHKIAGPTYNIVRFLERVAKGDLKARVKLRTGDDLQKIATSLNEAIEGLQSRDDTIKHRIGEFLRSEMRSGDPIQSADRAVAYIFRDLEPEEDDSNATEGEPTAQPVIDPNSVPEKV